MLFRRPHRRGHDAQRPNLVFGLPQRFPFTFAIPDMSVVKSPALEAWPSSGTTGMPHLSTQTTYSCTIGLTGEPILPKTRPPLPYPSTAVSIASLDRGTLGNRISSRKRLCSRCSTSSRNWTYPSQRISTAGIAMKVWSKWREHCAEHARAEKDTRAAKMFIP